MDDVLPAISRLEKSVSDNKESIRELFSSGNGTQEQIVNIKSLLQRHGIV